MSELLPAIITGGLGAAVGSIGTALIQSMSSRGEARAVAADRVTNAAGNLADRLDKMNTKLEDRIATRENENHRLREAIIALTEAVEDLIPLAPEPARTKAKEAVRIARLAVT